MYNKNRRVSVTRVLFVLLKEQDDSTKQIASIVTKEIEKQLKNLGKKQKN